MIYVAATLGLMAATGTATYWIAHTDVPADQLAPSNATCVAYMEADQRYKTKRREIDELEQAAAASGHATLAEARAYLALPDPLEAERREAYLQAYRGVKSSDPAVMTRLLNADRWRCCKRLEPNRRACPMAWL